MHILRPGEELDDALAPYAAVDRRTTDGRPWVTAHMVAGLDGCTTVGGRVGALSTAPDKALFTDLRTIADVVLVGAGTVREEGYGPVRLSPARTEQRVERGLPATPPVAVVSRSLALDWDAPVFQGAPPHARTMVVTCAAAPRERLEAAQQRADVVVAGDEAVDPATMLTELAARGLHTVLCEGGPHLLGQLVAAGCVDELCLTISPMMGGDPLPVAVFGPGDPLTGFSLAHVLRDGETLFLRYERSTDG